MLSFIRKLRRSNGGFTLLETVTAISVFTLLSFGGLSLLTAAINSWQRDTARASLEADTGAAMRQITDVLRPAVSVMPDVNGQGLTYYLPLRSGTPLRAVYPLVTDGVARRIWRGTDGRYYITGRNRPLVKKPSSGSTLLRCLPAPRGKPSW